MVVARNRWREALLVHEEWWDEVYSVIHKPPSMIQSSTAGGLYSPEAHDGVPLLLTVAQLASGGIAGVALGRARLLRLRCGVEAAGRLGVSLEHGGRVRRGALPAGCQILPLPI